LYLFFNFKINFAIMQKIDFIPIHISIQKENFETILTGELRKLLQNAVLELDGHQIKLSIDDKDKLVLSEYGRISIPVRIYLIQHAGLFSVEADGKINAFFSFALNVNDQMQTSAQVKLLEHEWLETPKVRIGKLSLPVESISNFVLGRMHEDISHYINQKVSTSVNLPALIESWTYRYGNNYFLDTPMNLVFNGALNAVSIDEPEIDNNNISIHSNINISTTITDRKLSFRQKNVPKILEEKGNASHMVEISFRWEHISQWATGFLHNIEYGGKKLEVENLVISWDNMIIIHAEVIAPVEMKIELTGVPHFDQDSGMQDLKNYNIRLTPENLIYKIAAPVIRKIIDRQIESFFPVNTGQLIKDASKLYLPESVMTENIKLSWTYQQIFIRTIHFSKQGVDAEIVIQKPELNVRILG
jgi:hypothetical protein